MVTVEAAGRMDLRVPDVGKVAVVVVRALPPSERTRRLWSLPGIGEDATMAKQAGGSYVGASWRRGERCPRAQR
ncbi:hypothetical protein E2562_031966 [Oryza meyeriana var. granulata]|uniref:Uncharacterized protein n=1 Tax=Oryza meyeriana var. granulata TaxID=110450 RepID=A0A6G1ERS0_9ORYZ|nr:hypothetical protein E2562_031966 [Oryza meyeriana var. granulata]